MKFALILISFLTALRAEVLYETDFDEFPTGPNSWANDAKWISNDTTSGAQAIDGNVLPALLNTATLGFTQPQSLFTFVALELNYDHVTSGNPIVEIDALLGIEDSTNNRRDKFYLTIYNSDANLLCAILFDNTFSSQFGIRRYDGIQESEILADFIPGELFNLVVAIDLKNNTWSAEIDAIPLFTNAPFTATTNPVDFGLLSFEWVLSALGTFGHGDNFLLLADVGIQSIAQAPEPLVTSEFDNTGTVSLSWEAITGWSDQVQYSTDLVTWLSDLPNSTFTGPGTTTFHDSSTNRGETRYYRVRRTAE